MMWNQILMQAFPFQKVWIHQKGLLHGTGYFKIFLRVL